MREPSSPRGWLQWSIYVLESQARPFSPSYEYTGRTDPRMRDSRESALSVKILAERASKDCSSNGDGYELLMDFYVREASWWSFNKSEQQLIEKTARAFARLLREAEFLLPKG
jgi:hypothetical protein